MPALDEADLCLPLDVTLLVGVAGMQTQTDGLVTGDRDPTADGMGGLALVVGEIDAQLLGEQVTRKNRVGTAVDQPASDQVRCSPYTRDTGTNGLKTGSPSRVDCASSR